MSGNYPDPFKPEVNVPVWVEIVPDERYGFDPQELHHDAKEIPIGNGKTKKIPDSISWRFNVIDPKEILTSWFINWESIKNTLMEMTQAEAAVAESVKVAVMLYLDGKKHHLCLYAASTGYKVIPDHDIPIRFKEYCGVPVTKKMVSGVPPKPQRAVKPPGENPTPTANDLDLRVHTMKIALDNSAKLWHDLLDEAFDAKEDAEANFDPQGGTPEAQVVLIKATEFHAILKEAAVRGVSTVASSIFIELAGNGRKR